MIAMVEAAIIRLHWVPCSPVNIESPSGTVASSWLLMMISGHR